jgi:effector-binding domain-containing protein
MQIKEVKPINFLHFRTKTRISELGRFVGIIARELYRDATYNDLEVTGPVYWNYFGFDGDESGSFVLEIALPVAEIHSAYNGKFRLKREGSFHCVSTIHEGSWFDLPRSYSMITEFLTAKGLEPCACNREIYLNIDFMNPNANVTEIQIGISEGSYARFKGIPAGRDIEAVATV